MAGEFDPLNAGAGDLYSIMGGIPGGGPVGAIAAGNMFQQQLAEKAAQAEQLRQAAALSQAQAGRTTALTQPEVEQTRGLAELYRGQAGRMRAETGGLELGNIARGANLPGEVQATGAKYSAEVPKAGQEAFNARASMSLPFYQPPQGLPPDMAERYIDTFGAQSQLSKDSNWPALKENLMKGVSGQQALGLLYANSPRIAEAETQGQFQVKEREIMANAEKYVADQRRASAENVANIRGKFQMNVLAGKDPMAALKEFDDKLSGRVPATPEELDAIRNEYPNLQMRAQTIMAIKQMQALNPQQKGIQEALINSLLSGQPMQPVPQPTPTQTPTPGTALPNLGTMPGQQPPQPTPQGNTPPGVPPGTQWASDKNGNVLILQNGQWQPLQR